MTFDNFTIKAQQAVQHAIDKATGAFFYFQRRGDVQQTDKKPVSF